MVVIQMDGNGLQIQFNKMTEIILIDNPKTYYMLYPESRWRFITLSYKNNGFYVDWAKLYSSQSHLNKDYNKTLKTLNEAKLFILRLLEWID